MASTLNIPGYYYDTEKKKYFKIEKSHAVPAGGAAWSADSVKKRRLEDEEAARALRRMSLDRRRVSRARVLGHCLTGGFLDRELFGGGSSSSSAGLRKGPGDLREAAFAAALEPRGKLPLKDARWTSHANVNHLYVDGQDRNTDMCVAFASIAPYHEVAVPQISDIKYHQPSNQILIASRSPGQDVVIWTFAPKLSGAETQDDTNTRPRWLLGWSGNSVYRRINTQGDLRHHDYQAHAIAPAPAANPTQICAIGTNRGVIRWVADGYRAWLTPRAFAPKERNPYTDIFALDYQRLAYDGGSGGSGHPDVLLFGGRPGRLWISDCRQPCERWGVIATPSPITHIRSLNEHQVLVAGLRDRMVIYDLRFLGSKNSYRHNNSSSSNNNHASHHNSTKWLHSPRNNNSTNNGNGNGNSNPNPNPNPNTNNTSYAANVALPLLTFPSYRNGAHINIGLDVSSDADVGAGPGIAAAAHDDGTVALYSLRSGNRLRAPLSPASPSPSSSSSTALPDGGDGMLGIDRIRSPRGPIQALQFQTFPRDRNPSLFVGVQSSVNVYSFGTGDGGDDEA